MKVHKTTKWRIVYGINLSAKTDPLTVKYSHSVALSHKFTHPSLAPNFKSHFHIKTIKLTSQSPVIVEKVLNRKTLLVINCRGSTFTLL